MTCYQNHARSTLHKVGVAHVLVEPVRDETLRSTRRTEVLHYTPYCTRMTRQKSNWGSGART
jgi:hypothetical protein